MTIFLIFYLIIRYLITIWVFSELLLVSSFTTSSKKLFCFLNLKAKPFLLFSFNFNKEIQILTDTNYNRNFCINRWEKEKSLWQGNSPQIITPCIIVPRQFPPKTCIPPTVTPRTSPIYDNSTRRKFIIAWCKYSGISFVRFHRFISCSFYVRSTTKQNCCTIFQLYCQ